jgi:hypothetical protein
MTAMMVMAVMAQRADEHDVRQRIGAMSDCQTTP